MIRRERLLFFVWLAPGFTGCAPREKTAAAPDHPALVESHLLAAASPSRDFPAILSAQRSADVTREVDGLVREIGADTSARASTGEAIARFDERDFRSRLLTARAEADRARNDAVRAESLLAQNTLAPAHARGTGAATALAACGQKALAALREIETALDRERSLDERLAVGGGFE